MWFHLQGYIDTQNNRYWSSNNPHLTHDVQPSPVKVGVRCAVSAIRIVGPVSFYETINCERYVQVTLGQFFPELIEEERLYGWFQQDSATAHSARMSMQVFVWSLRGQNYQFVFCLHVQPILIPVIFFFWGVWRTKFTKVTTERKNWKKIFVGKSRIFLQNSFKTWIRTSSGCARNVYV
jgi:hypothetical protein